MNEILIIILCIALLVGTQNLFVRTIRNIRHDDSLPPPPPELIVLPIDDTTVLDPNNERETELSAADVVARNLLDWRGQADES